MVAMRSAMIIGAILLVGGCAAQSVVKTADGNYVEVTSRDSLVVHDSTTTMTFACELRPGTITILPVYRGPKGGLYVWRPLPSGALRKQYMPKDQYPSR